MRKKIEQVLSAIMIFIFRAKKVPVQAISHPKYDAHPKITQALLPPEKNYDPSLR